MFGRQKEVSPGVRLIHFISWSAKYCPKAKPDTQRAVAVGSHRLSWHRHLANLLSLYLLLQLANHNYSGSSVRGKRQIPCCDFLQLEQVKVVFVVHSWEATPLFLANKKELGSTACLNKSHKTKPKKPRLQGVCLSHYHMRFNWGEKHENQGRLSLIFPFRQMRSCTTDF